MSGLTNRRLAPGVTVSPQIDAANVAELAASGVSLIVCNRPDGEDPGQADAATLKAAAESCGVAFLHMPVMGRPTVDQADALGRALEGVGQAHLYCRSGMRSTAMWAMMKVLKGAAAEDVEATAAGAGYDLTPLGLASLSGSPRS